MMSQILCQFLWERHHVQVGNGGIFQEIIAKSIPEHREQKEEHFIFPSRHVFISFGGEEEQNFWWTSLCYLSLIQEKKNNFKDN